MTYVEHDLLSLVHRWRCDGPPKLPPGGYAPPGSPRCGQFLTVGHADFERAPRAGDLEGLARLCAAAIAQRPEPWLRDWQFVRVEIERMEFGSELADREIPWDRLMCPDHRMPFLNDDEHAGDPIRAFGGSEKGADILGALERAGMDEPMRTVYRQWVTPVGVVGADMRCVASTLPHDHLGVVQAQIGDETGPEWLTPEQARQYAAALTEAAEWVEAQQ